MEKGQPIKMSSHLRKLCPQLQDGVLRAGGRFSRSSMPMEVKHPMILAKDLHISELLLGQVYQQVGHGGRNHMLSKLREVLDDGCHYGYKESAVKVHNLLPFKCYTSPPANGRLTP